MSHLNQPVTRTVSRSSTDSGEVMRVGGRCRPKRRRLTVCYRVCSNPLPWHNLRLINIRLESMRMLFVWVCVCVCRFIICAVYGLAGCVCAAYVHRMCSVCAVYVQRMCSVCASYVRYLLADLCLAGLRVSLAAYYNRLGIRCGQTVNNLCYKVTVLLRHLLPVIMIYFERCYF